jgi:hypothetical protein
MKNILKIALVALFGATLVFSACKKDESNPFPEVTAPSSQDVLVEGEVTLSFSYTADAGFKSSSVTAQNGTAVVTTDGTDGAGSGTIEVTFTAGSSTGAGSVVLSVTDKDDQTTTATAVLNVTETIIPTFSVTQNIDANTTWTTGNVYILEGRITVLDGATLTIEPGVIVKGREGSDVNATALIIARGGTLNAQGTANSPIIFTSVQDNIVPGEVQSPNLEATDEQLWGGLIVLGKARGSFDGDALEERIEGIPETDSNGRYGGSTDTDNSGTITYISIRHGGQLLGEGNEINGLTLGGVGSGTTIENVEVVANLDDGIEFFGGAVNVTNAVVWNAGDDALDTDQGYNGTVDNFVIINPGDACFELDGPEGSDRIDDMNHTFSNGTVKAVGAAELCDNDLFDGTEDGDPTTNVNMNAVYFYQVAVGATFHTNPNEGTYGYGDCTFANFEIAPSSLVVADYFEDGFDAFATAVDAPVSAGADLTAFDGWSWARVAGEF